LVIKTLFHVIFYGFWGSFSAHFPSFPVPLMMMMMMMMGFLLARNLNLTINTGAAGILTPFCTLIGQIGLPFYFNGFV
jgi:hypothetical protein